MSKELKNETDGAVNVRLAVLWSKPNNEPIYQDISHRAAANSADWCAGLDSEERLWLVDKVETTAIYGERVVILDRQGDWLKVAAVSQRTLKDQRGYPGWVLMNQVSNNPTFLLEQRCLPEAVVSVPQTTFFSDTFFTKVLGELGYQTRLPVLQENEDLFIVRLPDGDIGYLARKETKKAAELSFSSQGIVEEAQRFIDLKYLWGGTTSYGFDCSGLMFRLYQSQGISIPRDASEQAQEGSSVSKESLRPGDLLFFAYRNAHPHHPNLIHHVALYIGEGLMIHSPNSKSQIRIEPFESGIYGEEFWGARRYATEV